MKVLLLVSVLYFSCSLSDQSVSRCAPPKEEKSALRQECRKSTEDYKERAKLLDKLISRFPHCDSALYGIQDEEYWEAEDRKRYGKPFLELTKEELRILGYK